MWKKIKNYLGTESVEKTAEEELYSAKKALLIAQTKFEYAQADVAAQSARVKRLQAFVDAFKGTQNAAD